MPDWFYRTVTQPMLFRLEAVPARDLALGFMGRLARSPVGPAVIELLGRMQPDRRLRTKHLEIDFPGAVGLGPAVDGEAAALPALARFGFGFVEAGPLTTEPGPGTVVQRRAEDSALWWPQPGPMLAVSQALPRLAEAAALGIPLLARLAALPGADPAAATGQVCSLLQAVRPHVRLVSLGTLRQALGSGWSAGDWASHVQAVLQAANSGPTVLPVLLCVPADREAGGLQDWIAAALAAGGAGLQVDGLLRTEQADGSVSDGRAGLMGGAPRVRPPWGWYARCADAGGARC